jgi:membrane fusion protein, macrolide-specific efflux system
MFPSSMPRTLNRRIVLLTALFAILLAPACSGIGPGSGQSQPTPTSIPTAVVASKPTYEVRRGDIVSQIKFNARVIPVSEEQAFFRADGYVRNVYFKAADEVKKGDILADLMSIDKLEENQRQMDINLRRAEISLEMARIRQGMQATQTPAWIQNHDDIMALQAYEVEMAQLNFDEQQLQASKVQTSIDDSQLIAPMDGQILTLQVHEGDPVGAFQPVVVIGNLQNLEAGAKLLSTQMENMTEGMACLAEFSNRPGEKINCSVRQLPFPYGSASEKKASQGITLVTTDANVRITLDLPAGTKLRMGDLLNITVILQEKKDVLLLPVAAIRTFEGRNFVVVQTDTNPRRTDIKTGLRDEDAVEIIEGLEEGQVVVSP